ncbi:hypothetical protein ZIOFF_069094 [Zingiber officinale]|uniref:Uncharacterized protein n=1 Tax=Zingiber officinale TaxID=94328 RepID=A0A8J5C5H8_ZINOF|nr:hypothetical protein ZIOFF_069094 [Zingiber officinale]
MNHPEEVLNEEGPLHGEEEVAVLLTPIGTLKIRMMEMKGMDMEEAVVEAEVMVVDEVETLDGGKQQRKSFKKYNQKRASSQLELVHSDICGPIKPISFGGNRFPTKRIGDITREEAWSLRKPKRCGIDEEQTWNWNNNNNDDMKQISFEEDYKEKEDKQGEEVSSSQQVDVEFFGFSGSDWAGSYDDCKSTTDILLQDLRLQQEATTKIYVDNKSAIALAKNPVHHERFKHIDTHFHFIREYVKSKEIELLYVKSSDQ